MTFRVTVQQFGEPFPVEMGQTILEAALARDLSYPHGCRSGNCGACKSELLSGEVEMSPYSEYALSAGEKDSGLILACRAVPWSDCAVKFLEFDDTVAHPLRHLVCRVSAVDNVTHDIKRLRLKILEGGPYDFTAGQYASLTFPGLPARDYSMANRPGEPGLEFHIRLLPRGAVTPFVAGRLKVGDKIKVFGPHGTSYLRERHTGPVLALAGGSGLAPIKSIVETALASGATQPIHLYVGVRDERDLYLENHFKKLAAKHKNLTFVPVLSEPSQATKRRTGFLADAVRQDFTTLNSTGLDGAKAYLAGPPLMVETAVAALEELGLRRQDCHADAFYTEAEKAALAP
ncbi:MAG: 2Fe-2S iron-sulfur cluster binding domain-containing protein [Alphaproteobacteria bacterium]|nr:2Fe-2S iron-sulfur cluster binding domain-containing protein [Alphaproteobacteria bacterium]